MYTTLLALFLGFLLIDTSLPGVMLFGIINRIERKINEFKHFLKVTDRYFKIHKR